MGLNSGVKGMPSGMLPTKGIDEQKINNHGVHDNGYEDANSCN